MRDQSEFGPFERRLFKVVSHTLAEVQRFPWIHVLLFPGLSLSSSDRLFRLTELSPFLHSLFALCSGGLLAFGLSFSEFLLVSCTSSLTLSITGIFKVTLNCNGLVLDKCQLQ